MARLLLLDPARDAAGTLHDEVDADTLGVPSPWPLLDTVINFVASSKQVKLVIFGARRTRTNSNQVGGPPEEMVSDLIMPSDRHWSLAFSQCAIHDQGQ
jgi:hypothetical protein